MKFWNCDQHISVILDMKDVFTELGHTIDDVSLSGHAPVIGRERGSIPMLDGDKWCGFVQRQGWHEFHETYFEQLAGYDGFIVTYPPLFAYLYKNFDKPIIVNIPIRYEYPCQSSAPDWIAFNKYLQEGVDAGKIILTANNPYDKKYTEMFLQRPVKFIPSLCRYTDVQYNGDSGIVCYYAAKQHAELEAMGCGWRHNVLPHGHSWSDVARMKAIVHLPYNVSTMSIMEHFAAGIPLLFPTQRFLRELYGDNSRRIMEQYTWPGTFGREPGSVIDTNFGWPDPNDFESMESFQFWMKWCDFYSKESMDFITYFDSWEDLRYVLNERTQENWNEQSRLMKYFFKSVREPMALNGWKQILSKIGG